MDSLWERAAGAGQGAPAERGRDGGGPTEPREPRLSMKRCRSKNGKKCFLPPSEHQGDAASLEDCLLGARVTGSGQVDKTDKGPLPSQEGASAPRPERRSRSVSVLREKDVAKV